MKIGAMQGILGTNDEIEAIRRAAYWGFDSIELISRSGADGEPIAWTNKEKLAIKDALKENGIGLSSICAGSFNQCGLIDPGSVGEEKVLQGLIDLVRDTAELKSGIILVPFFGKNRIKTEADQKRAISGVLKAIPAAEKYKVVLALEMTAPAEIILDIVGEIDSQCAGVYYDVGNMASAGFDNAVEIPKLGGFISAVHIKDRIPGDGGVPLGEGCVDFAAVRGALAEIGYDQVLTLETPSGNDPETSARQNLSFTRGVWM